MKKGTLVGVLAEVSEYHWNTNPTILDDIKTLVDEMNCGECGGFGYHKMSCSHVK